MSKEIEHWYAKVLSSRYITSGMRCDLQKIDRLYCTLARLQFELHNFRKETDVEYTAVGGVVTCKDEKTNLLLEEKEESIGLEVEALKKNVADIVECRTKLITSEITHWRKKKGRDFYTKYKEKRHARGGLVIVGELKDTLRCFLSLVNERDVLSQNDLKSLIFKDRLSGEDIIFERERQRERANLHNFTGRKVTKEERQILNYGGGFVMKGKPTPDGIRKHRAVKKQTELALLSYVEYLAGVRVRVRVKEGGRSRNVRKEIFRYFFHPRIGCLERRFITKALKLVDFYFLNHVRSRSLNANTVRGMTCNQRGLKLLRDLSQDDTYILRESDKNLGWSLNNSSWYKHEYDRHSNSGFYNMVGNTGDVDNIKLRCRLTLQAILKKHKEVLSIKDYKGFNLSNRTEDYTLPSLNLFPKVHKLKEKASTGNENVLTGRPIVTGYGWCTIEASKYLQKRFRSILVRFKEYLESSSLPYSILGNSYELVSLLKKTDLSSVDGCTFVTYDFKDLYTNILYKDASYTLRELARILGIGKAEVDLLLDLYTFCNDWNFFNVGNSLFKQVKGVSMCCYFNKEISDLVLLYSEYKYFLVRDVSKVIFLKRYADDGIMLFSVRDSRSILSEIRKIMLFYPSNLVVNIVKNHVTCQYLDLVLAVDDVTLSTGVIHYWVFFKKFHKFAYLNPKSNHPKHVFKGLVKTECMRYIRNSLCKDDYMLSLKLFTLRLLRAGYRKGFIQRNVISYEEGLNRMEYKRTKKPLGGLLVYPLMFDKADSVYTSVERILMKAKGGLPLPVTLFITKRVDSKLRNIFCTRKGLQRKMTQYYS